MSKSQQNFNPFTLQYPFHQRRSQSKWNEIQGVLANAGVNYVSITGQLVPISFVTAVNQHLLDIRGFDFRIGVKSIVEEVFWQSLDDEMRDLVGVTVAFLLEHEEWFQSLPREIADRATGLGGNHD